MDDENLNRGWIDTVPYRDLSKTIPHFQVPKTDYSMSSSKGGREAGQSYRYYVAHPPKPQPLHTLYPGRYMTNSYHYTGDNIPNDDLPGAYATQKMSAALSKAADNELQALELHLGGKHKVTRHPPVEPEALLEDPRLDSLTPYLKDGPQDIRVKSPFKSLSQVREENEKLIERDTNSREREISSAYGGTNIFRKEKLCEIGTKSQGDLDNRENFTRNRDVESARSRKKTMNKVPIIAIIGGVCLVILMALCLYILNRS
jgi:hypothetical protein